jgi:hypothetical protein
MGVVARFCNPSYSGGSQFWASPDKKFMSPHFNGLGVVSYMRSLSRRVVVQAGLNKKFKTLFEK